MHEQQEVLQSTDLEGQETTLKSKFLTLPRTLMHMHRMRITKIVIQVLSNTPNYGQNQTISTRWSQKAHCKYQRGLKFRIPVTQYKEKIITLLVESAQAAIKIKSWFPGPVCCSASLPLVSNQTSNCRPKSFDLLSNATCFVFLQQGTLSHKLHAPCRSHIRTNFHSAVHTNVVTRVSVHELSRGGRTLWISLSKAPQVKGPKEKESNASTCPHKGADSSFVIVKKLHAQSLCERDEQTDRHRQTLTHTETIF